jgi:hypothetical protein
VGPRRGKGMKTRHNTIGSTLGAALMGVLLLGCSGTELPETVETLETLETVVATTSTTTTTVAIVESTTSTVAPSTTTAGAGIVATTAGTVAKESKGGELGGTTTTKPSTKPGGSNKKSQPEEWVITIVDPCWPKCAAGARGKIIDNGVIDVNGVRIAGSTGATVENCGDRSTRRVNYWFKYENGTETNRVLTWDGGLRHVSQDSEGNYAAWLVLSNFETEGPYTRCTFSKIDLG